MERDEKRKSSYLDQKVRVVAKQGHGRRTFDQEVKVAAILAARKVQDRKAFIVYGD